MSDNNGREMPACLYRCPEFLAANDHRLPDDVRYKIIQKVSFLLYEGTCSVGADDMPETCQNSVITKNFTAVHIRQAGHDLIQAYKSLAHLDAIRDELHRDYQ